LFILLLLVVLIAIAIHWYRSPARTPERLGVLTLLYVLVGYCGVPMLLISVWNLADPALAPRLLGFAADNPFQTFLGWAYLGMSLIATAALRWRGAYLIGPALVWATFFAGATSIHLADLGERGALTHSGALGIFAMHGLISLLLLGGLGLSGLLRRR
jgi:hypothetical protein